MKFLSGLKTMPVGGKKITDGSIDDDSFVQGIQFLVQEGFMKITN